MPTDEDRLKVLENMPYVFILIIMNTPCGYHSLLPWAFFLSSFLNILLPFLSFTQHPHHALNREPQGTTSLSHPTAERRPWHRGYQGLPSPGFLRWTREGRVTDRGCVSSSLHLKLILSLINALGFLIKHWVHYTNVLALHYDDAR